MRAIPKIILFLALAALLSLTACRKTSSDDEPLDTSSYRPLPTPLTELEQLLKDVRDAHFKYVWVLTRLDGQAFTSEDRTILEANAPKVVDRIGTNDKKTFILGSNFPIEEKNLQVLKKRYKIEDRSGK